MTLGVVYRSKNAALGEESLALSVIGHISAQHLDRNGSLEGEILASVHCTKRAAADLSLDSIRPVDDRSDHGPISRGVLGSLHVARCSRR